MDAKAAPPTFPPRPTPTLDLALKDAKAASGKDVRRRPIRRVPGKLVKRLDLMHLI
jgi:hypothetical protein